MTHKIRFKLSLMMFLEFFIWGSWFATLGTFLATNLNASGGQIGDAYSTQSWGAIIAPFFIGLIADKYFNAEKILGILHIIGAILLFLILRAPDFTAFYPYLLGYMILYMPTLALVNSVSFRQMKDPAKDFARIRLWGTIGWIVAGVVISYVFFWDSTENVENGMLKNTFLMGAISSLVLGILSFTLPQTPPKIDKNAKTSLADILGLDTLKLFKDKNFLLFFIASVLICIPLAFYYQYTNLFLTEVGVEGAAALMTIGQASEVVLLLFLPFFFKRYGFKNTLIIGMLAWALRYFLFAYGNAGELFFMLIVGIALHGICYDFFFVCGQIYTDEKAGEKYKSSAQGFITLATYGVGMLIGFWAAGKLGDMFVTQGGNGHNWEAIWIYPAIFAALVLLLFAIFFKNEKLNSKN